MIYPVDSVTHPLNNWGQNNYSYEICVMRNLVLNDVMQESQTLETRPSGPTIAVGLSELIVHFNLQFSFNNYLVTRLLIGMDLELFSF